MSETTPETFLELFDIYEVEVPIIQRDYAQGRNDDHAKMVRENLLKDMKSAIQGEIPPLDLNFVYGKAEKNKFIPIDGQQRLTTLFLLYLYAFYDDESKTELLRKFTYETRKSSRNFLEKLIEKRKSVFTSALPPSKEIDDCEWFVSSWKYDPTIQSALTMLDDIKVVFGKVENLAQCLSEKEFKPITFKFHDMKGLGMEDSLYIKLNARGKPLTPLENFKARLIGQLQKLNMDFINQFEFFFDGKWTDLFWLNNKENFDHTYLTFFGVLLMNKGICPNDVNWSNRLEYEKIGTEVFETAFYTLNFLSNNPDCREIHQLVFNALTKERTYKNRVLFHAVSTYMYMAKGIDNRSLRQWIRIIQNLTLNSQIDSPERYRNAIEGINKLAGSWYNLIEYFSQGGNITGFSLEQATEEQKKASIILQNKDFAEEIYKAEKHPYFSGQIRSALYYALDEKTDMEIFVQYWGKISALFDETRPKHGHLLRRALLTFGDYTLPVGNNYKTLCVNDPNEAANTPSLKRLFSNRNEIVKQLLDVLTSIDNIEDQLKTIIKNSTVPKNSWQYCFINFPELFEWMSISHLRLRWGGEEELIMVPNKASNGYNYGVFLSALHQSLKYQGVASDFRGDLGTWADRYLYVKEFHVRFKDGKFIVKDTTDTVVFETTTNDPITEVSKYIVP
jgi:hypothetical protein